jgi:DNA-binding response OmpR family regulator
MDKTMPTVLLVEDALELADTLTEDLIGEGFEVLHAADGLRAIELHAAHKPDVIVLDWMLPKLDGINVLRHIRQSAATPVIMLTARTEELDRITGLEVGADDYLTKPFSTGELIARLRALLRRVELIQQTLKADRAAGERETITHGGLTLDVKGHRATLNDEPLDLSRTEFDLLHLFMRNPGRAFSRAYLLDAVWGTAYVSGDRAVDNAVLRLRKKLGPLEEAIETVWGVGYRFRHES